jgi:hypothetical protein
VPALATDALLPVEEVHTDAVAVMAADGAPTIVTIFLPDAVLHPLAFVTVTASVTVPEVPAV